MKRLAVTLEAIAERENLLLAAWKAAKGKRHRGTVRAFFSDLDGQIERLRSAILTQQLPCRAAKTFTIHDPKKREITAAAFIDRVAHHAILNVTEAWFERSLLPSVYACRKGFGVHAAVFKVQENLQKYAWVTQVDVAGYFPSIDHGVLKKLLARRFKGREFLALLGNIIDCGGKGLPIGSLTSQHLANFYLNGADRFLSTHVLVQAQVRYMDDMVFWTRSKVDAQAVIVAFKAYLMHELCLSLKERYTLQASQRGLAFCGYRVRQGVVLAGKRKMRRARQFARKIMDVVSMENLGLARHSRPPSELELQRAQTQAVASLLPAQSLHFRRHIWGYHAH